MKRSIGLAGSLFLAWLLLGGNVQQVVNSIVATACTNQFIRSVAATGAGTCASVAIASDVSGLGTGVATALGVNVGSAGAPVVNGGALGTPSSGVATNFTSIPVVNATGVLPSANGGAGTINGPIKANGSGTTSLYAPARSTSQPTNPTGTATTASYVQAGLAGAITPTTSGNVLLLVTGTAQNNTIADGCQISVTFGTGTAPTNGVAQTGTFVGGGNNTTAYVPVIAVGAGFPFIITGYQTGLTVSTAYWYDIAFRAVTGGTCSMININMIALEQ